MEHLPRFFVFSLLFYDPIVLRVVFKSGLLCAVFVLLLRIEESTRGQNSDVRIYPCLELSYEYIKSSIHHAF
jgi:hypothetical protein